MDLSLDELIAKRTKHSAGCGAGGHNKGVSALLDLWTNRTNGNGGPIRHSGRTTASSSSDSNGRYVNTPSTSRYRERANGEYSNDGVYRIVLSNLDFGVTSEDLRLLLGEFGSVKCAEVRHNEYGKSLGKADVIFTNKNSALMAIRRYHNTCLDGRYIKFKLISKLSTGVTFLGGKPVTPRLPNGTRGARKRVWAVRGPQTSERGGGGYNRNSYRRRRGGRGAVRDVRKNSKKTLCKDDLDAQLDDYMRNNGCYAF